MYSPENEMYPGVIPPCLQNLTQVEEMLIACACPIMCVFHKHGGQRGYKGHVVNLPQNVQRFLDTLPANVNDLPLLIVHRQGDHGTYADFRVQRDRVLSALLWLKENNRCYRDIVINHEILERLPENSMPPNLLIIDEHAGENQDASEASLSDTSTDCYTHSFLPTPAQQRIEENTIRSVINRENLFDWPIIEENAINEYQTLFLATMAFPALFPYAAGDPTNPARHHLISITDGFKHLIKFDEVHDGCNTNWRLASHPRFPYWALNMKQRHQLLSQSSIRALP